MLGAALVCLVVAISDGDTLKARCGDAGAYEQVIIRLAEIDAPEKRQAFGTRSKLSLSALCFAQWATIQPQAKDRYGRTVARVQCRDRDASSEQVRQGMAWFFTAMARTQELRRWKRALGHLAWGCGRIRLQLRHGSGEQRGDYIREQVPMVI